jgi:hypothetical protein
MEKVLDKTLCSLSVVTIKASGSVCEPIMVVRLRVVPISFWVLRFACLGPQAALVVLRVEELRTQTDVGMGEVDEPCRTHVRKCKIILDCESFRVDKLVHMASASLASEMCELEPGSESLTRSLLEGMEGREGGKPNYLLRLVVCMLGSATEVRGQKLRRLLELDVDGRIILKAHFENSLLSRLIRISFP